MYFKVCVLIFCVVYFVVGFPQSSTPTSTVPPGVDPGSVPHQNKRSIDEPPTLPSPPPHPTPSKRSIQQLIQPPANSNVNFGNGVPLAQTAVKRSTDQQSQQQPQQSGNGDTHDIILQIIKDLTPEQRNEITKILSQTQLTKKEIKKQLETAFNNWQKSDEYTQAEDKVKSFLNTLKGKSGDHPAIQKFVDIVQNDDLTLEQEKQQLKTVFKTASQTDVQLFKDTLKQEFPEVGDKFDSMIDSGNQP